MPHVLSPSKRPANYSNCPLKKRPIKYEPEDEDSDTDNSRSVASPELVGSEPENLSTKPQDLSLSSAKRAEAPSALPISLVAGRNESDLRSHHAAAYNTSEFLPVAPPHVLKSGSPLESISLNSPWSRGMFLPNYPIVPYPRSESLSPAVPASYSRPRSSSGGSAGSLYSPARYSPYSSRDGSSPARMSPPTEVAYPLFGGVKHEEGHRGGSGSSSSVSSRSRLWSPVSIVSSSHPAPTSSTSSPFITSHHMLTAINDEQYCYPSPPHSHGSSSADFSQSVSSRSSSISSGSQSPVISSNSSSTVNGSVRYQCPDCNKSYSTFSGLSKHLQFHCASQNKKEFVCKHCEKVYVSLGALKMHIRTHTLPCKCNLCGKAFSRPWLLQGHIRTHTGEKPFTCQHCNRAFADRSNLRAHLQTHSEVKKYSCKTCAKTFSRMSLLVKHEDGGCSSLPC